MLNMVDVMNALQRALPQARFLWHSEGAGLACVVATLADEEHFIGVTLDDVDAETLVASIMQALTA